jgi:hypothetical protein
MPFASASSARAETGPGPAGYSVSSTVSDFLTGLAAQRVVYAARARRATWAWRLGLPASSQA